MNELEKRDTDMVMTVLEALQAEMTADLDDLQNEIRSVGEAVEAGAETGGESGTESLDDLLAARTALHSGLASIREVLGWIDWITERKEEEEAEGDSTMATLPLPSALGFPIH